MSAPKTEDALPIQFRGGTASDEGFIFSTWLKSYRHNGSVPRGMTDATYYATYHRLLENILRRPSAHILFACDPEEPLVVYGYVVWDVTTTGPIVQWAYVKRAFRSLGVFRSLVDAAGIDLGKCTFTHLTPDAERIQRKFPGAVYNPYLI